MANIRHRFLCEAEDPITNGGPWALCYSFLVRSSMGCNPTWDYGLITQPSAHCSGRVLGARARRAKSHVVSEPDSPERGMGMLLTQNPPGIDN